MAAKSTSVDTDSDDQLNSLKSKHDEAYLYISQGLSYEEQGEYALAKQMYDKGLKRMNEALDIRCDRPHCLGTKWDSARKMQDKMRRTAHMVNRQLNTFSSLPDVEMSDLNSLLQSRPPSYEEACGDTRKSTSLSQTNGHFEFHNTNNAKTKNENGDSFVLDKEQRDGIDVEEIFAIPDGVQLFFVSSEGRVTAQPSSLHIYKFTTPSKLQKDQPPAWLQIGSWVYPLIPGQSPSLYSKYGAYMFPDLSAEKSGSAVGIILPDGVNLSTRKTFEALLLQLTSLETDEDKLSPTSATYSRRRSIGEDISNVIVAGAEMLSVGLTKGAEMTGSLLHKGASFLKDSLNPEDKPVSVDPRVQQGLKIARDVSGAAVKVSGFVVGKLGEATLSLARYAAPHLRQQGVKMLSAAFKADEVDSANKVDNVMIVAAGGLQGFSTIYMGLETAARTLAYSLLHETVEVVNHKYGKEVSGVVDNAMNAVGNLAMTTHNVTSLGVKAVAKRTAKDTGKEVLKDYLKDIEKDNKPNPS